MREVVKKEVIKLLDAGIIYPVPHSEWVSPVHDRGDGCLQSTWLRHDGEMDGAATSPSKIGSSDASLRKKIRT
jgi:hypothetical protein